MSYFGTEYSSEVDKNERSLMHYPSPPRRTKDKRSPLNEQRSSPLKKQRNAGAGTSPTRGETTQHFAVIATSSSDEDRSQHPLRKRKNKRHGRGDAGTSSEEQKRLLLKRHRTAQFSIQPSGAILCSSSDETQIQSPPKKRKNTRVSEPGAGTSSNTQRSSAPETRRTTSRSQFVVSSSDENEGPRPLKKCRNRQPTRDVSDISSDETPRASSLPKDNTNLQTRGRVPLQEHNGQAQRRLSIYK